MRLRCLVFLVFAVIDGMLHSISAIGIRDVTRLNTTASGAEGALRSDNFLNDKPERVDNDCEVRHFLGALRSFLRRATRWMSARSEPQPRYVHLPPLKKSLTIKKYTMWMNRYVALAKAGSEHNAIMEFLHEFQSRNPIEDLVDFFHWLRSQNGLESRADKLQQYLHEARERSTSKQLIATWLRQKTHPKEVFKIVGSWLDERELWFGYTEQYRKLTGVEELSAADTLKMVLEKGWGDDYLTHGIDFEMLMRSYPDLNTFAKELQELTFDGMMYGTFPHAKVILPSKFFAHFHIGEQFNPTALDDAVFRTFKAYTLRYAAAKGVEAHERTKDMFARVALRSKKDMFAKAPLKEFLEAEKW